MKQHDVLLYSLLFSSKLQSELRTTNLEELKIAVETYFEEVTMKSLLLSYRVQISRSRTFEQKHPEEREKEADIKNSACSVGRTVLSLCFCLL